MKAEGLNSTQVVLVPYIIFHGAALFHNGCSSENNQRELSNENQHDKVKMVFKNLWVVASALKGLMQKIYEVAGMVKPTWL